ncbi:hypothetical protein ACFXON_25035, partial [Bacillus subtilis]
RGREAHDEEPDRGHPTHVQRVRNTAASHQGYRMGPDPDRSRSASDRVRGERRTGMACLVTHLGFQVTDP